MQLNVFICQVRHKAVKPCNGVTFIGFQDK
jgi:hypothetical protein